MRRSHELGLPVRVHADAWASSQGWRTAVDGGAVSAEHLTYTSADEIREVGRTDTVAVLLPMAELIYMTSRRADARLFIEHEVPVAIATDFCSSIHATSLLNTVATAAPWFRMTPAEVIVGATLNAAYSLGLQSSCGSLDVGKRGDLLDPRLRAPRRGVPGGRRTAASTPSSSAARWSVGAPAVIRVVSGEFGGRKLVVPDGSGHPPDHRQGAPGGVQLPRQRRAHRRRGGRRPLRRLRRARHRGAVARCGDVRVRRARPCRAAGPAGQHRRAAVWPTARPS